MRLNRCLHKKLNLFKKNWLNSSISLIVFFLIFNIYGKMEHKMLHNAPSLDLSSIILFWKKSRKIDHESWIDIELIWNLIFPCFEWRYVADTQLYFYFLLLIPTNLCMKHPKKMPHFDKKNFSRRSTKKQCRLI